MGMKRRGRWGVLALVAVVAVVGGGVLLKRPGTKAEVTVNTATVERGTVTTSVSGTGVLQPLTKVEVKSNVGGQIVLLSVDEGDRVTAGQLIARIDPADAESALEQSQADLDSAHARVLQAQKNLTMQQEQYPTQVRTAEKAVESARLRLAQAEKQATLQKTQTVTSLEQARESVAVAKARLAQAEEQALIQPQLTDTNIAQAKSALAGAKSAYQQVKTATVPQKLAAAQASLDQAKANLTYAASDLKRQKELHGKGFVARSAVDSAEQRHDVARAALDTAQQKMDTVKDETKEDLASAQARVEQAEASLRTAEANRVQDRVKQQDVLSAQAAVRQAEAGLKAAEANRVQDALKADDITSAKVALEQAEAALVNVRANRNQDDVRRADITQASAQVKRSEASVSNARTSLGYTTIVAPRAGVVVKKYVEEGSIVSGARSATAGGGITLLDLADVTRMHTLVNIDETDIAQIQVGQEVEVTVDAFPDELFIGKVTKIAPQTVSEQNVTTIPVTVEIEAPDLRLKPGMNATCDFITSRVRDVLVIPRTALKPGQGSMTVLVMTKGKPVSRTVRVGMTSDSLAEITEGLQEGEVVVSSVIDPRQPAAGAGDARRPGMGGPGGMPGMGGGRR